MAQSLHGHEARDVDAERPAVPAAVLESLSRRRRCSGSCCSRRTRSPDADWVQRRRFAAVAAWIAGNISPEQVAVNRGAREVLQRRRAARVVDAVPADRRLRRRARLRLAGTAGARLHRTRAPQQRRQAARAGARRRRDRRLRRQDREGLHERAGADRWRDAQRRQPRVHGRGVRRRPTDSHGSCARSGSDAAALFGVRVLACGSTSRSRSCSDWVSASASSARASAARASSPRCSICYDMAVVKVMFTAIVTAMAGLFLLSAAGMLDLDRALRRADEPRGAGARRPRVRRRLHRGRLLPRHLRRGDRAPGARTPPRSRSACCAGVYAYAEFTPWIDEWIRAGAKGEMTLPTVTGLPMGVFVAAFALFLLFAAWGMRRLEDTFRDLRPRY